MVRGRSASEAGFTAIFASRTNGKKALATAKFGKPAGPRGGLLRWTTDPPMAAFGLKNRSRPARETVPDLCFNAHDDSRLFLWRGADFSPIKRPRNFVEDYGIYGHGDSRTATFPAFLSRVDHFYRLRNSLLLEVDSQRTFISVKTHSLFSLSLARARACKKM